MKFLLGRALGQNKGPYNIQNLFAKTFQALQTQGVESMAQVLEQLGITSCTLGTRAPDGLAV